MIEQHYGQRRYVMAIHGRQSWNPPHRRRRAAQESAIERPVRFQPGEVVSLPPIIHAENLLATMDQMARKCGPGPGLDRVRLRDLSRTERGSAARSLSREIKQRTYQPGPAREKDVPKSDGGTRTLKIRSVFDRAVSKAVMLALLHHLDAVMWPGSMGFRPRRKVLHLVAELDLAIRMGNHVIVHVDIRKAFDNVPVAMTVDCFRQHIVDADVMWLVETVLRGHEGASRHIGIDQGDPLSTLVLNILLNHVLDWPLRAAMPDILLWRYADNIVIACQSMTAGRQAIEMVRQLLNTAALTLKDEGDQTDLRRQGARLRLLGHETRLSEGQPAYGISRGSWRHLAQQLQDAHRRPNPAGMANEVICGWLSEYGPAYEFAEVHEILDRVYGTAARNGFRETDRIDRLTRAIGRAWRKWSTIRGTASLDYQRAQQQDTERVSAIQEIDDLRASGSDGCPF